MQLALSGDEKTVYASDWRGTCVTAIPTKGGAARCIEVGAHPTGVAAGGGSVLAADSNDATLAVVDRSRTRSRLLSLAQVGRRDEALQALSSAVVLADELVGPPARWQARAVLGKVSYELGDDEAAAAAYGEAGDLVEGFVATLAPERAAQLLAAPDVDEIVSLVGRRAVG